VAAAVAVLAVAVAAAVAVLAVAFVAILLELRDTPV